MDYVSEIKRVKKEKNAVILAHFYTNPEVQDIADFVGDSLQLSQEAAKTDADIIVFAGVNFMAETAKILSPQKKVLLPDLQAGCSLAESCDAEAFGRFLENYPDHTVVSYVNTSVGVKALTDICCTSSNALKIIDSIPSDQPIVFAPDRNLGDYLKRVSGRENMVIWDGACHVHEEFSLEAIVKLKKENPEAKVIAHPECKAPILLISDFVGSTAALLNFVSKDGAKKFIVVTEAGILHQMRKNEPEKIFIPAPPSSVGEGSVDCGGCNDCKYMKLNSLRNIYVVLLNETNEIEINEPLRVRAHKSIAKMLELSR